MRSRLGRSQRRLDHDLAFERAVDGAAVSDGEEALALRVVEVAVEGDRAAEAVDLALFRLARGAILRVEPVVLDVDRDAFERPVLAVGVHPQRHRGARPERGAEEIVGRRSLVRPTDGDRLVGDEGVLANGDAGAEAGGRGVDGDAMVHHLGEVIGDRMVHDVG